MIELRNVTKTYGQGQDTRITAVRDVSLVIPRNTLAVLRGSSGSGKTSLLTLIGCMARPSSGRIRLQGVFPGAEEIDVSSLPERFLTEIRRRSFGFIFQHLNLIHGISALENVMLPAHPLGADHTATRKRAMDLLDGMGIAKHARTPVERLSGGEGQRVGIARALINDPAVLIADEPTAHLDSALSAEFVELLASFKATGKTILVASHDPIVSETAHADLIFTMKDGRMLSGAP